MLVSVVVVRVSTTDLVLELVEGDRRQGGSLVNDRGVVNTLVNGHGGVDGGRLDGLTLDHGLDGLVNVVVDVLVGDSRSSSLCADGLRNGLSVLVHSALLLELLAVLGQHVGLGLTDLLGQDVVLMLGLQHLLVGDRLDAVLVVVDVTLAVNSLGDLGVLLRLDVLLDDLGRGLRADLGGVVLVRRRKEFYEIKSG